MDGTVTAVAPLVNKSYTPRATVRYLERYYELSAELVADDTQVRLTGSQAEVERALRELWPASVAAGVVVERSG